jgi:hypothetical protein
MKKIVLTAFIFLILPVSLFAMEIREVGSVETNKGELKVQSNQDGDVYLDIAAIRVKFNEEEKDDLLRALETAVDFSEKAERTDVTLTVKTGGIKQKTHSGLATGISVYFNTEQGKSKIFLILKDFSTALFIKAYISKEECEELVSLLRKSIEKSRSIEDQLKLFEL